MESEQIKAMIDNAKTLAELHSVWSIIKTHHMHNDEVVMAWYDFKYNLIGNI